jgi:hypothetical protein
MSTVLFDAAKHEYRNAKGIAVPSVTQILALAGICDFSFVEEERRIAAMERGTSVHWLLQLEDEGALNYRQVPLRLRPYRKAWQDWKKASGFMPELIEHQFISHYGYAGTIDRYGTLPPTATWPNGSKAIIDLKTGEVADWTRLQLVGYAMRMHSILAIARRIRRIAVALRANGTYSVREFPQSTFEVDWSKFIQAKRSVDAGHVEHGNDRRNY